MVRTWSLTAILSFWKIPQTLLSPTLHLRGGNVNLPPDHLKTAWNRQAAENPQGWFTCSDVQENAFRSFHPVGPILNKIDPKKNKENEVCYPEKCLVGHDLLVSRPMWSLKGTLRCYFSQTVLVLTLPFVILEALHDSDQGSVSCCTSQVSTLPLQNGYVLVIWPGSLMHILCMSPL